RCMRDGHVSRRVSGTYSAGAILSIDYRQDAPIVDTNERRVLRRVFLGDRATPSEKFLWRLSEALLPRDHAYDFNQELMDFGATVCSARLPRCPGCPLSRLCVSYPLADASATRSA